jgi:hypothetical protein
MGFQKKILIKERKTSKTPQALLMLKANSRATFESSSF